MHFQEPKILVQFAGSLGEQIRSNWVAKIVALPNGGPARVGMVRNIVNEEPQHGRTI